MNLAGSSPFELVDVMPRPKKTQKPAGKSDPDARLASPVRIIGGAFRGRTLEYQGDPRTRPMKDRVREAVYNLLGPMAGLHVIDLFAGTGALALEAISRGAISADAVEKHFPTADVLKKNVKSLAPEAAFTVRAGDAFYWATRLAAPVDRPWVVFCSPPYVLYVDRKEDMLLMIADMIRLAPQGSQIVVECDERFDPFDLPRAAQWSVRTYPPAIIAILRVGEEVSSDEEVEGSD
jgi:16S rRNA (guanine966-N2)-methyltransferase